MTTDLLFLLLGLVLLVIGGDLLVRGAVRIAERLRLSPMLIGLTIVGMGTSTPELAASVQASLAGSPGIAVGNIVGSNIANSLLILGAAALIAPFAVKASALWRDGGVGLIAAVALLAAGATVGLTREAGLVFLAAIAGYIYYAYRQERVGATHSAAYDRSAAMEGVDPDFGAHAPAKRRLWIALILFAAGLGLIVTGGGVLVSGAIGVAETLGVSDAVIGLTIVAIGTSLPELVTSAMAAWRRQGEMALGNVLGSNIYNILFIGGLTGVIAPTTVPPVIAGFDLPVLVGVTLLVMLFAYTGGRLSRREGAILVVAYAAYAAFTAGIKPWS
jgi:cation:H+ antiporter